MKKNSYLFLAGIMGIYALAATIHASQGVMLSSYISEYSLVSGNQGISGSVESIGLIAAIGLTAFLLTHFSKKTSLLILSGIMTLSLVGLGLHLPYGWLCACYGLFGLTYGGIDALSSSLISDIYRDSSAKVMGYVRASYCLGGLLAPACLAMLMHHGMPWYMALLVAGLIGSLIFLLYCTISHRSLLRLKVEDTKKERINFKSIMQYIGLPGAKGVLLFGVMYGAHQIGLTVWITRYITTYTSPTRIGEYALTLFWVGALLSRSFLPRLLPSHRTHMVYGNLIAGILLTIGIVAGNGALLCILMPIIGFVEGTSIPMLVDYVCEVDRKNSAVACSTIVLVDNIGGMIAPTAIALLISFLGPKIGIYVLPFTSFACSVIALLSVKRSN